MRLPAQEQKGQNQAFYRAECVNFFHNIKHYTKKIPHCKSFFAKITTYIIFFFESTLTLSPLRGRIVLLGGRRGRNGWAKLGEKTVCLHKTFRLYVL